LVIAQQRQTTIAISVGLAIVLGLLALLFRSRKKVQQANETLIQRNEEINQQKEEILAQSEICVRLTRKSNQKTMSLTNKIWLSRIETKKLPHRSIMQAGYKWRYCLSMKK
jgi:hypothetical protein